MHTKLFQSSTGVWSSGKSDRVVIRFSGRVRSKYFNVGIHSFPAWRSAFKRDRL